MLAQFSRAASNATGDKHKSFQRVRFYSCWALVPYATGCTNTARSRPSRHFAAARLRLDRGRKTFQNQIIGALRHNEKPPNEKSTHPFLTTNSATTTNKINGSWLRSFAHKGSRSGAQAHLAFMEPNSVCRLAIECRSELSLSAVVVLMPPAAPPHKTALGCPIYGTNRLIPS